MKRLAAFLFATLFAVSAQAAATTLFCQNSSSNYDAANNWNTAANGSGTAYTNPQNGDAQHGSTSYVLDINSKTSVAINVNVTADSIQGSDSTGFFTVTTTRTLTLGTNAATAGVNYSGGLAGGLIQVGASGALTITGAGSGTTAVLASGTAAAIIATSSGAVTINNTGGTGASSTSSGVGVNMNGGTGALIVSVGAGNLAGVCSSTGRAFNVNSTATTHAITGDLKSLTNGAARALALNQGTLTFTGQPIAAVSISGQANPGPVDFSGGILKWTGTTTLAASADYFVNLRAASGLTLDLTGLTLTVAGRLCINDLGGGNTITTSGTTIATSGVGQAVVLGHAITITYPGGGASALVP